MKWNEIKYPYTGESRFERVPNDPTDNGMIGHASIYPDSWSHWCEIADIKPRFDDPVDYKAEATRRKDIEIERLRTQVNGLIAEIAEMEIRNSYLEGRIHFLKDG